MPTNRQPDFAGAITHAVERLRRELPPAITYHNVWHTEQDVLPAARRLAQLTGYVGDEELRLLEVAAAYHDIGFIEQAQNHEIIGARIVAQTLPSFGFASREIEGIMAMLLATRMPQTPYTMLGEILADADLDVLGRPDFFERNTLLWQEQANLGQPVATDEWLRRQLSFAERHTYFTEAARQLRDVGKQANLADLRTRLLASAG